MPFSRRNGSDSFTWRLDIGGMAAGFFRSVNGLGSDTDVRLADGTAIGYSLAKLRSARAGKELLVSRISETGAILKQWRLTEAAVVPPDDAPAFSKPGSERMTLRCKTVERVR